MTAAAGTERATRPRRRRLELRPEQLRRRVDPARLGFESTAEIEPLVGTVGQPRVLDALAYGLAVETHGFNVFVAGEPGSGRRTTVLDYARKRASARPPPDDWVYVHNFEKPDHPNAIRLPAGQGAAFAQAMQDFVTALRREIPRAFESEEYEARRRGVTGEIAAERARLEEELIGFARSRGVALEVTPAGVVSMPLVDGETITREQFDGLPQAQQDAIRRAGSEVEEHVGGYAHQLHQLEKETASRLRELEREVALFATAPLFRELEERFGELPEVSSYVQGVRGELLSSLDSFRGREETPFPFASPHEQDFGRFRVNTFVENAPGGGAPIVVERNPTYYNLIGRVEYRAAFGAMVTDFREVKAGALHRANGGFLLLDIVDVLRHPFAWEALKRALRTEEIKIENLAEELSAVPTASLRPEPIPLRVKVVLIGPADVYRLLYRLDEDFRELFKVKAEFSPELDWSAGHQRNYAAFVSRWVRENGLRHLDRAAVARVIEHGARLRGSQRKLTARLIEISDLVSEASFWAEKAGHELVTEQDLECAIRKQEYRADLLEERIRELIADGTLVIETEGERVGQLNGISVLELGDHSFGRPSRVSARVSLGRGRIASIEREIELSGPIHSKGFMTLSGYLAATYAQEWPLAVSATLTFEQSYDEIEGDSASSTELYALLSALSGLPLAQGVAVTGSVDQHGEVQAVGGVTRKVEGFYAVCKAKGLTGRQGVLVPAANVRHLMLDEEVVEAVRAGRFHVWAVRTVDEGIELLTGRPAGRRHLDGTYPPASVHGLVEARLAAYAERLRDFAEPDGGPAGRNGRPDR